ncbi:MAG: hypothetical protein AB7F37_10440, partial [Variibacter sp.]
RQRVNQKKVFAFGDISVTVMPPPFRADANRAAAMRFSTARLSMKKGRSRAYDRRHSGENPLIARPRESGDPGPSTLDSRFRGNERDYSISG